MRVIRVENKEYRVPDDATDDEVNSIIGGQTEQPIPQTPKEMTASVRAAGAQPMRDVFSQAADDVATSVGNIPSSFGKLVGGVYDAVTSPVQTVKGLGNLAAGAVDAGAQKLEQMVTGGNQAQSQPGWENARATFSGFTGMQGDRYGSFEKTRQTMRTDPVGVLSDAATLLGIGAGTLKLAGANNAAKAAMKASSAIDPFNLATKGISSVGRGAGNAYNYVAGASSTVGKNMMDEAMRGSDDFLKSKKGVITDEMVVKDARNAINTIQENRNLEFANEIPAVKNSTAVLDPKPIGNKMNEWVSRLGGTLDANGNPMFTGSKSKITGQTANEIQSIVDEMKKTDTFTPDHLDSLRQRLGQLELNSPRASKMAAEITEKIRETIEPAVPGYTKTLQKYAKSSELLNELRKSLSLGDQRTIDTAIRKLITTARDDSSFRGSLLKELDTKTGGDLMAKIAGRATSPVMSGRLGTMATALAAGGGLAYLSGNPGLLAIIGLASPKVASWGATQLGRIGRGVEKRALGPIAKGGNVVAQMTRQAAQDIEEEKRNGQ